jgi:hypothetical protein
MRKCFSRLVVLNEGQFCKTVSIFIVISVTAAAIKESGTNFDEPQM